MPSSKHVDFEDKLFSNQQNVRINITRKTKDDEIADERT